MEILRKIFGKVKEDERFIERGGEPEAGSLRERGGDPGGAPSEAADQKLEQESSEPEQENSEPENENSGLERELNQLKNENEELKQRLNQEREEIEMARQEFESERERMNKEREEIAGERERMEERIKAAVEEAEVRGEIRGRNASIEAEFRSLEKLKELPPMPESRKTSLGKSEETIFDLARGAR